MTGHLVPRVMWGTWAREVHSGLKVLTEILEFLGPQAWWGSEDSRADPGWSDQLGNLVKPDSRARTGRTESPGHGGSQGWWGDRAGLEIPGRWV